MSRIGDLVIGNIEEYGQCPKCDGPMSKHPALSRRDNKTEICSSCGTREALEDFINNKERS